MDYTTQPLFFRITKVLRYVRLYGPSRTYVKVLGQLHMKKRFEPLPPKLPAKKGQRVGLIGCGNYSFSNIAYYLHKNRGDVIAACMDVDPHRAASMSRAYG